MRSKVMFLVLGLILGGVAGSAVTAVVTDDGQTQVLDRGTPLSPASQTPTSSPSPSPTSPPASSSPSPSPSPTPASVPADATFVLGDTVGSAAGNEVTAYLWDKNVNWPIDADPGKEFSRAEVGICTGPDLSEPIPVNEFAFNWSLEMPNHTRIASESSGFNSDELLSQFNLQLGPNECARGLVIFQTPAGQKPAFVVFSSSSVIKWAVD